MLKKISKLIATFFGAGLSPKAPGTAGSLATLPLAFVLAYFFGFNGIFYAVLVTFFVGVLSIHFTIKDQKEKDPSYVVIDETAGQLATFLLLAQELQNNITPKALFIYVLGFGLFRFFDIIKMGPVKWADTKLKNAWGVMLDDVFAGINATIVLLLLSKGL